MPEPESLELPETVAPEIRAAVDALIVRVAAAEKNVTTIAKVREGIQAHFVTIAHEREQCRSMIEQGTTMKKDGETGLDRLIGAEIALKKQLADLDAALVEHVETAIDKSQATL